MRGKMENEMELIFDAKSSNEALARVAVAAFVSSLDPTLEEISDIKTAISEAVTNAIIHGYGNVEGYEGKGRSAVTAKENGQIGKVRMLCRLESGVLKVLIEDRGKGMENVGKAMEPLFTTRPDLERSGMGFSFMEAFMDDLQVDSALGAGTIVRMQKKLTNGPWIGETE